MGMIEYLCSMKFRPSKTFVRNLCGVLPLLGALMVGLWPELDALRNPPIPGDIVFSPQRPDFAKTKRVSAANPSSPTQPFVTHAAGRGWSLDWMWETWDQVMSWEKNPWKLERPEFCQHYFDLMNSEDPADRARAEELCRLGDGLYRKMLARYPELALPSRDVPAERNGSLKLLELAERFDKDGRASNTPGLPGALNDLVSREVWDSAATREELLKEKPLMDEIRRIGLMPERSIKGIDILRWGHTSARFYKGCADVLLAEARLAAEEGNSAAALESIRAANGIAAHLGEIETPSLLATTVQVLIHLGVQKQAFATIIPSLPSGSVDVAAWKAAVVSPIAGPDEFARILKGEWSVTTRQFLAPMLMDTEDPHYPRDPGDLLDAHAGFFLQASRDHEGRPISDLHRLPVIQQIESSHLSYESRRMVAELSIGAGAWRKGWERKQSVTSMAHAAFAIMGGEPVPRDPVFGLPYVWDPATRTLSPPDSPEFKEMEIKPIVVPAR
jgi:hypothetical protein